MARSFRPIATEARIADGVLDVVIACEEPITMAAAMDGIFGPEPMQRRGRIFEISGTLEIWLKGLVRHARSLSQSKRPFRVRIVP